MSYSGNITHHHVEKYRKEGLKWGAHGHPYLTVDTKDDSGSARVVMVDARDDGLYFCCTLNTKNKPHFRKAENLATWMQKTLDPYWHLKPKYEMPEPAISLDEIELAQGIYHELTK